MDERGYEESAIAAFWISNGVNTCCIGFLPRNYVKHWKQYEGVLGQVVAIYSEKSVNSAERRKHHQNHGCCRVAIISTEVSSDEPENKKRNLNDKKEKPVSRKKKKN